MPWVGMSFETYEENRDTARSYKEEIRRFLPGFCNYPEFKEEKLRVTFSGHTNDDGYGEYRLSPSRFYNLLVEWGFPFDKVDTIDLYGCRIGLGDDNYLYQFAEELYKDPSNRHIKVKAFTSWGAAPNEDLTKMYVAAGSDTVEISTIEKSNLSNFQSKLITEPRDDKNRVATFYRDKYSEVLFTSNRGLRETLDSNPNFTMSYDAMKTIEQIKSDVPRFKIWIALNNQMAKYNPSDDQYQKLEEVKNQVKNTKENLPDIQLRFPAIFESIEEASKATRETLSSESSESSEYLSENLKIAIDNGLYDELATFDPNLLLPPSNKHALLYAIEHDEQAALILLKNGADPWLIDDSSSTIERAFREEKYLIAIRMLFKVESNEQKAFDYTPTSRHGQICLYLAEAYKEEKLFERAAQYYKEAAQEYDEAIQKLLDLYSTHKDNPEITFYALLGLHPFLIDEAKREEDKAIFSQLAKDQPETLAKLMMQENKEYQNHALKLLDPTTTAFLFCESLKARWPLTDLFLASHSDSLQTLKDDTLSPLCFEITRADCDYTILAKMLLSISDLSKIPEEERTAICAKEMELLKAYKEIHPETSPSAKMFSPKNEMLAVLNELKKPEQAMTHKAQR
jgi:hypothetical protein